jgi:hypothetical protein
VPSAAKKKHVADMAADAIIGIIGIISIIGIIGIVGIISIKNMFSFTSEGSLAGATILVKNKR